MFKATVHPQLNFCHVLNLMSFKTCLTFVFCGHVSQMLFSIQQRRWSLVPCLHLILRYVLVDRITSRRGRHIPVYIWCFNPSLLSTFNHFCSDFFKGRVYGWAFSDLDLRSNGPIRSRNMNDTGDDRKTQSSSSCFCSDSHKTMLNAVSVC
jgi:hypothetical protein